MSLLDFLVLLVIAAICGSIGQSLAGFSKGGCIVSIILGFIGAWLGQYIADEYHLPQFFSITISGRTFPVVWAIIGSTIISVIIGLLTRSFKEE